MKVLIIALKDLTIAGRDKKGLLLLLAMPLILIAILGSALSQSFSTTPKIEPFEVGIVDQDQGPLAQTFIDVLNSAELKEIIIPVQMTEDEAKSRIQEGKLSAAIVIPPKFSQDVIDGSSTALEVLSDQTQSLRPLIVESICRSFINQIVASQTAIEQVMSASPNPPTARLDPKQITEAILTELDQNPPQAIEELSTSQPPLSAMEYYSAGMGVMFLLFAGQLGLQSISGERRRQTLHRLLATPTSSLTFVFGKFLGILLIAFTQFLILALGTSIFFKVDWGNSLAVLSVALAYSAAISGMALAVSAWVPNERVAIGAWSISVQILSLLGGSMIPLMTFPDSLRTLAYFTPNYWALQGLLQAMQNGPFPWASVLILFALGAVTLGVGSLKVRI